MPRLSQDCHTDTLTPLVNSDPSKFGKSSLQDSTTNDGNDEFNSHILYQSKEMESNDFDSVNNIPLPKRTYFEKSRHTTTTTRPNLNLNQTLTVMTNRQGPGQMAQIGELPPVISGKSQTQN